MMAKAKEKHVLGKVVDADANQSSRLLGRLLPFPPATLGAEDTELDGELE
jgi:hypothetical protein